MLRNADIDESFMVQSVFKEKGDIGYNVRTEKIENLRECGVIDPTKVIRVSLENAASVAGTILTTEHFLIEMKG